MRPGCSPELWTGLFGAELPVPCITQTWPDEAGRETSGGVTCVCQAFIDGRHMHGDIGMAALQRGDPFRRGQQADKLDAGDAAAFEDVDGGQGRAAGRQHGVEHKTGVRGKIVRKFIVVDYRLQGLLVAVEAQVPDLGLGDKAKHSVYHAQAGAQDRDQADAFVELVAAGGCERCLHLHRLGNQVGGGFVGQDHCQFGDDGPKLTEVGRRVPKLRNLVLHQWMVRHKQIVCHAGPLLSRVSSLATFVGSCYQRPGAARGCDDLSIRLLAGSSYTGLRRV